MYIRRYHKSRSFICPSVEALDYTELHNGRPDGYFVCDFSIGPDPLNLGFHLEFDAYVPVGNP